VLKIVFLTVLQQIRIELLEDVNDNHDLYIE